MDDTFWDDLYKVNQPGGTVRFIDPPPVKTKEEEEIDDTLALQRSSAEETLATIEKEEGITLNADARGRALEQIMGGNFDLKVYPSSTEEFWSDLYAKPAEAPTAETPPVMPKAKGYWESRKEELGQQIDEIKALGTAFFGSRDTTNASQTLDDALADPGGRQEVSLRHDRFQARFGYMPPNPEKDYEEAAARQAEEVAAARKLLGQQPQEIKAAEDTLGGSGSLASRVARVGGSFAATPEQLGPIAGGVVGAYVPLPGAALAGSALGTIPLVQRSYRSSYREAIEQFGASPEEASAYANANAAIEFGVEAIGGKVVTGALGILGAKSLTKGAIREGLAQVIKSRAARVAGASAVESLEEVVTTGGQDALLAGMEHAEVLGDPKSRAKLAEYNAQRASGTLDRYLDSALGGFLFGGVIATPMAHLQVAAEKGAAVADTKGAALGVTAREKAESEQVVATTQEEQSKEDAFRQSEPQLTEEQAAVRKADEEEAGFRTIERQRTADKLAQNPAVTVAPVEAVSPEEVQAEREQAQKAEAARVQRVAMEQQREQLSKGQPVKPAKAPQEAPTAAKPKKRRVKAPKLPMAPAGPDAKLNDQGIADIAKQLGLKTNNLNMAAESKGTPKGSFSDRAESVIKALVHRNTQPTADIQNLLRQGKLVLAPNAKYLNRADTGAAAQYDPETGKMYLYLDKVNTNQAVPTIVAALHESTHAGQFNDREGRPSILRQMMGQELNNKVKDTIAAAYGKNQLATKAIDKAIAAAKKEGNSTEVAGLEVVPYFVGEATKSREGFGRLGGVVKDIKSAAKGFVREKLGVDLDISLDEIESATQKVAGEIVSTETKPGKGKSLDMIAGLRAKGAIGSKNRYSGAVDGLTRFEFSDKDAELASNSQSTDDLADREVRRYRMTHYGAVLPLDKILDHDELFSQYPDAREIEVKVNPSLEPGVRGTMDAAKNRVNIHENLLKEGNEDKLLSTIIHEVQHWIQSKEGFVPGANMNSFLDPSLQKNLDKAKEGYKKAVDNFDLDKALNSISDAERNLWEKAKGWHAAEATLEEDFLMSSMGNNSSDPDVIKQIIDFQVAQLHLDEATNKLELAKNKAYQTYLRDYGEAEARNTEHRKNFTDEERKANPPESTMKDARGKVKVERTIDTRKVKTKVTAPAAPASVDEEITETKAFKNWFKDSKVTDTKGKPKVVYHGTMADFDEFKISRVTELGAGYYFTEDAEQAAKWAGGKLKRREDGSFYREGEDGGKIIMPVYLSLQNPAAYRDFLTVQKELGERATAKNITKALKEKGFDGVWDKSGEELVAFDAEQIKSATGNKGTFNPRSANILDMAAEEDTEAELPFTRRIPSWVSGLLSSSAGAGSTAREIFEHAAASPAGQRMIAEGTVGRYRDAIEQLAAARGITQEELNNEIADKLDKLNKKSNSYEKNLANFKSVAKQYGPAGEALIEFREQVDNLSMQMLKDRAAQNTPLTKAERKTYETIFNNLGRYSHRQFAVNMGKGGKTFAKTIWDDYAKYVKTEGKNASPKVKQNYERVANAVSKLIDHDLMIPNDAALDKMDAKQIRRRYSIWSTDTNNETVSLDDMRARLRAVRDAVNGNKDLLQKTGEALAKDILGLNPPTATRSVAARYYRGGKLDKGILKERTNIAPEIRDLMGEIKDPAMRLFATVAKQTEFIARNKMLMELRDKVEGEHLQPPGPAGRPEVKGMVKLEGDAYGPLQNHYVSENVANLISDYIQQLATFEQAVAMAAARPDVLGSLAATKTVRAWGWVAGRTKMMQIVGKPVNFLYNLVGGPRTMLINGNLNPLTLAKAVGTSGRIIAYAFNPAKASEDVRRVTTAGITDSAFVGEINGEVYAELGKTLRSMQGKTQQDWIEGLTKAFMTGKETYAMMDVVYKIANFYHQADIVLPAYYKAAGIEKSQAEIDREAADIVNTTNVTYKRAAPLVRGFEKYGFTNFGTFFYEVFRTEINNVRQGLSELKRAQSAPTPEAAAIMRNQGAKRLIGQLTAWSLTAAASKVLGQLAFGDDEEKERKLRKMLPEYMRNQDFVVVGKDENGVPILFDISRIDPAGPITDIIRSVVNEDADIDAIGENIFQLYVAPRVGVQAAEAIGTTTGLLKDRVKKPLLQEMFPTAYSKFLNATDTVGVSDRTTKAWTNVAETGLPGITSGWKASNPIPQVTDTSSAVAASMAYMGGRMYQVDNDAAISTAGFEYSDTLKDNRKRITELFIDHPDMDAVELTSRLADMKQSEQEAFDQLSDVYQAMVALDVPESKINARLKRQGLSKKAIRNIRDGDFVFRSVSRDSIKSFRDRELTNATRATPEEREEIKARWQHAWELLRTSAEELKEE